MNGLLFMITAPSGAGKTTLISRLLDCEPGLRLSVSYTTRSPRNGEIDGQHYHFISKKKFLEQRDRGDFLEWAEVFGNYYGTSKQWLNDQLLAGSDVLVEIDWQGARQIRQVFPQAISIFILPPSIEDLKLRLEKRSLDSIETINRRLAGAEEEIRHADEFDYVMINRDLAVAELDLRSIIRSSRLTKSTWQNRNQEFITPDAN